MTERMDTDRVAKVFAADFVKEWMDEFKIEPLYVAAHIGIEVADLMRRAWRDGFRCAKKESDEGRS